MNAPPTVELRLRHMEHAILQAFHEHELGVTEAVEAEVKRVVDGYDFAAEVQTVICSMLRHSIKQAIERAVGNSIHDRVGALANELVNRAMDPENR